MKKGMIAIDLKKCLACKSCEIQCSVAHSLSEKLEKAISESPLPRTRIKVEKAGKGSVPLQCRHCEEAPCVLICPTKAIKKTGVEEPVIIDSSLCIGCKFCVQVCPFGVVFLDSQGKGIIKCDLCLEKLKKDKLPVCVKSCPTGAIEFKLPSELSAELRKKIGKDLVAIIG